MHGSIQLIVATESERIRQAEASRQRALPRKPFAAALRRLAPRGNGGAAHRSPSRAAPTAGTDARTLGHPSAASLRGR